MLVPLLRHHLAPYRTSLLVVLVLQLAQTVASLYLPSLNAAIIDRGVVAGDTDLFDEMELIGPVDYALLPIFGWGPGLGPGHMDPERAAEAARRLQAKVAIPIHWGTLWPIGRGLPPREPADEFIEHCARVAPDTEARLLEPGSTIEW